MVQKLLHFQGQASAVATSQNSLGLFWSTPIKMGLNQIGKERELAGLMSKSTYTQGKHDVLLTYMKGVFVIRVVARSIPSQLSSGGPTRKTTPCLYLKRVRSCKMMRGRVRGKAGDTHLCLTPSPRWPCGRACVIRDLIKRQICCGSFPGRESLPWQPHPLHRRLIVGN